MKIVKLFLIGVFSIILAGNVSLAETIPFDSDKWEIKAKESKIVDYLGQKSLYMNQGLALIKDSEFTDGIIEYDVAFSKKRGFFGAVWRLQDSANYEKFYMRPHQSGNPDANQYTPVFNHQSGWQLYYGKGYGAAVKYAFDEWIHVKIVVSGQNAEVYIKNMDKPVLSALLKRNTKAGKIGLIHERFEPVHFANFSFTPKSNPPLKGKTEAPAKASAGTVITWSVSDAFKEKVLAGKFRLSEKDRKNLTWEKYAGEPTGLLDLARANAIKDGKNTVFARATVIAEKEQIKPLKFGFSDRVKVYLNGQLIYGGNNTYRTRDYRYLGTISFFDQLYLPLKKGENELMMAVSESFGGWGVQARFDDMNGIAFGK